MEFEYPVCKLWLLLSSKYHTTQPFSKFSKEFSLDYNKVRAYGANVFKKIDTEFLNTLCEILNCTTEELIVEDKESYFAWRSRERTKFNETNKVGVVYFVKNKKGFTKIGRTQNLKNRLKTLKYDPMGDGIKLIHFIESDDINVLENTLHKAFADKRVEGEWFNLSDRDLTNIKGANKMKNYVEEIIKREEIISQLYDVYQMTENEVAFDIIGKAIDFIKQQ